MLHLEQYNYNVYFQLQDSLLRFPALLMPLLDKCNIEPDKEVNKHEFFGVSTQLK